MYKDRYPCLLLLNDIHVSKDNIPEFTVNWNEAVAVCDRLGIEDIALGGDLFQSRSSQTLDVLLAVGDALTYARQKGIHVTLANGNHDRINPESVRGYCHIYGEHTNVTVVDESLTVAKPGWGFAFHMIAYFPENGSFREKLGALIAGGLDKEKPNFLYIHEGINGALSQPSENELPANIFGDFDKVFVGHYHNRAVIEGTGIEYIGSSRQHNFGEDERKGYTVVYSDGSHEFIVNEANTRYRVIGIPAEKVDVHLTDLLEEIKADGRYRVKVRVYASPALAPAIDRNRLLEAGANKVEIVTEDTEAAGTGSSGLFEKFDSRGIQDTYRAFCAEKNIGDAALGLSYLSKIESTCGN